MHQHVSSLSVCLSAFCLSVCLSLLDDIFTSADLLLTSALELMTDLCPVVKAQESGCALFPSGAAYATSVRSVLTGVCRKCDMGDARMVWSCWRKSFRLELSRLAGVPIHPGVQKGCSAGYEASAKSSITLAAGLATSLVIVKAHKSLWH